MGSERDHAPGMPAWVDLVSPDVVVSARFYGGLFGWDTATTGPADLTGGYLTFQLDGKDVAGLAPMTADDEIPTWTTYFAVRDADETEAAAVGHGGATLRAPRHRLEAGRSAVFVDPVGAVFGVWEPGRRRGVDLAGVPGTMCGHQLASRNVGASKRFYASVFEWAVATEPGDPAPSLWFRLDDGRDVAHLVAMDRSWPRGLPSHWMTSFAVDDCDAVAARAIELGGEVSVEPSDVDGVGRTAVLGDPHGAVFGVVTPIRPRRRPDANGHPTTASGRPTWPPDDPDRTEDADGAIGASPRHH